MNPAIYQLKLFEDSSLVSVADQIGLWDHAVKRSELEQMPADVAMSVRRRGEPVADAAPLGSHSLSSPDGQAPGMPRGAPKPQLSCGLPGTGAIPAGGTACLTTLLACSW